MDSHTPRDLTELVSLAAQSHAELVPLYKAAPDLTTDEICRVLDISNHNLAALRTTMTMLPTGGWWECFQLGLVLGVAFERKVKGGD